MNIRHKYFIEYIRKQKKRKTKIKSNLITLKILRSNTKKEKRKKMEKFFY